MLTTPTDSILVSQREAARLLNITTRTVYTLVSQGDLRPTRIGRRVLFARTELERFVAFRTEGGASCVQ